MKKVLIDIVRVKHMEVLVECDETVDSSEITDAVNNAYCRDLLHDDFEELEHEVNVLDILTDYNSASQKACFESDAQLVHPYNVFSYNNLLDILYNAD